MLKVTWSAIESDQPIRVMDEYEDKAYWLSIREAVKLKKELQAAIDAVIGESE